MRDREAGLRIYPTFGPEDKTAQQFNFGYRAADTTANPYLTLAMIIHAGRLGMRDELSMPEPTVNTDPENLSEDERKVNSIVRLPTSVSEALAALKADDNLKACLPEALHYLYVTNKTAEAELVDGRSPEELRARYAKVY